jgi:hypothetical protein
MALSETGKRHLEIALRIISGKVNEWDDIAEDDCDFLRDTNEGDIVEAAIKYLASHLSQVLGE